MGKSPKQAALEAADEIGLAVIATSLTLVSVFLPVALMPGIAGLVFKQFGWTASIAILPRWSSPVRSEEHTSELQSLMRISYAVFCLKKTTLAHAGRTRM